MIALGVRVRSAKPGSVIILRDPLGEGLVVKRVSAVRGDDVWLVSDNTQASADSRVWGWVERRAIFARIVVAVGIPGRDRDKQ
jgi:hypothetical protein